jgi:mono/diheme cytochrome c family protein
MSRNRLFSLSTTTAAAALFAVFGLGACTVNGADPAANGGSGSTWPTDSGGGTGGGSATSAAEQALGAELFRQNCAGCHGQNAQGGSAYGASLQGASGISGVVRNGSGGMPGFSGLSASDIAAIEGWLQSFVNAADPSTPRDVYAMECASCHGATGEGTARGPQIRNPVPSYAAWVVRNGRGDMPEFDGSLVSDDELDTMFTWLGSFPKPADGAGLFQRFCSNCHGGGGGLGEEAGELRGVVRGGVGSNPGSGEYMPAFPASVLSDADVAKIASFLTGGSGGGGASGGGTSGGTTSGGETESEGEDD